MKAIAFFLGMLFVLSIVFYGCSSGKQVKTICDTDIIKYDSSSKQKPPSEVEKTAVDLGVEPVDSNLVELGELV